MQKRYRAGARGALPRPALAPVAGAKRPHAQAGASSSNRDPCVCTVCNKRLKTPAGMLDHRLAVHKIAKGK